MADRHAQCCTVGRAKNRDFPGCFCTPPRTRPLPGERGKCGLRPDQVSGTPRISVRRINGTSPVCIPSPRSLRRASSTEVGPRSINRPVSCHVMHIRGPRHAGRRLAPAGRLTACPGLSDDRCRLTDTQATDAMEPPCHAGGDQSANGGRHAVAHHHRHRVATVRLRPEDRVRHDPCRRQAAQASRLGGCQLASSWSPRRLPQERTPRHSGPLMLAWRFDEAELRARMLLPSPSR